MPFPVNCPGCRRNLKLRDQDVGKNVRCPHCGSIFLGEAAKPATELDSAIPPSESKPISLPIEPSVVPDGPQFIGVETNSEIAVVPLSPLASAPEAITDILPIESAAREPASSNAPLEPDFSLGKDDEFDATSDEFDQLTSPTTFDEEPTWSSTMASDWRLVQTALGLIFYSFIVSLIQFVIELGVFALFGMHSAMPKPLVMFLQLVISSMQLGSIILYAVGIWLCRASPAIHLKTLAKTSFTLFCFAYLPLIGFVILTFLFPKAQGNVQAPNPKSPVDFDSIIFFGVFFILFSVAFSIYFVRFLRGVAIYFGNESLAKNALLLLQFTLLAPILFVCIGIILYQHGLYPSAKQLRENLEVAIQGLFALCVSIIVFYLLPTTLWSLSVLSRSRLLIGKGIESRPFDAK